MGNRKEILKYFFSVEGDTEYWYMKWLEKEINNVKTAKYKVDFDCKVEKHPIKYTKKIKTLSKTDVYHMVDYETDEKQFTKMLDKLKEAGSTGKQIKYKLCYSNITFDLWIVLHKGKCYEHMTHAGQYLKYINKEYNEEFDSMNEYKEEQNFKRVLSRLSLKDVCNAIDRAEHIMNQNKKDGRVMQQYKGYKYYRENPSLEIGSVIRKIFKDCGVPEN